MNLTIHMMRAFDDELEKQGAPADLLRAGLGFLKSRAGAAGALGGAGAALGGLGGAGIGGVRGYQEARRAGATRGQALTHALGRGASGAGRGAVVGGAVGALGGLAGGARAAELGQQIAGSKVLGAPSRFAQRQVHSLTGYASPEQVRAMGGGAARAAERAGGAEKALEKAWAGADTKALKKAVTEKVRSGKGLQAAEKAEKMGLTSVPGYLKSLAKDPMGTLRAGVAEQWHGSGPAGKAMLIGLPAASTLGAAAAPTEEGGPGRAERGLKALGRGLGYTVAPVSIAGEMVLEKGLGGAGGLVGAGVDKTLGRKKRKRFGELPESKTGPEPGEENAPHAQTYYSPAMLGRVPEGIGG